MTLPCSANAKFVLTSTFSLFVLLQCSPSLPPFTPTKQTSSNEVNFNFKKYKIEINTCNVIQLFVLGVGLLTLLGLLYQYLCSHLRYAAFNTTLNLLSKKKTYRTKFFSDFFIIMLGLFLLSECDKDQISFLIFLANLNLSSRLIHILLNRRLSLCFYAHALII